MIKLGKILSLERYCSKLAEIDLAVLMKVSSVSCSVHRRRALEWCVSRSDFFVFFETFLTGTCACIYGRKMCQRRFWAKPSTYN